MKIYKVYENSQFGVLRPSYWMHEDKANQEKQKLIDKEVTYFKGLGNRCTEKDIEEIAYNYIIEPITVNE